MSVMSVGAAPAITTVTAGESTLPSGVAAIEAKPVTPTAAAQSPAEARASAVEHARGAARQIEAFVRSQGPSLEFRVDDSTGVVVVSVRDAVTGDVIRQIPSEAALRIAESLASANPTDGSISVLLDEVA